MYCLWLSLADSFLPASTSGQSHINYTAPPKKILGALVFRRVRGVIWGADSENCIG